MPRSSPQWHNGRSLGRRRSCSYVSGCRVVTFKLDAPNKIYESSSRPLEIDSCLHGWKKPIMLCMEADHDWNEGQRKSIAHLSLQQLHAFWAKKTVGRKIKCLLLLSRIQWYFCVFPRKTPVNVNISSSTSSPLPCFRTRQIQLPVQMETERRLSQMLETGKTQFFPISLFVQVFNALREKNYDLGRRRRSIAPRPSTKYRWRSSKATFFGTYSL